MEIIVRIAHCARKEMSSVWSGACYFYLAIVMVIPVRWNKATANESKCKWTITKHHKSAWMFPPTIHFPSFKIIPQTSLSQKKKTYCSEIYEAIQINHWLPYHTAIPFGLELNFKQNLELAVFSTLPRRGENQYFMSISRSRNRLCMNVMDHA